MDNILTDEQIEMMKRAGKVAGWIMKRLKRVVKEGVTTKDIEDFVDKNLELYPEMKPAFKGYLGYPSSVCVSVNEEIIHGIPKKGKILKNGDIVSVDFGIEYNGIFVDTAYTYGVGKISLLARRLIDVCRNSLKEGIKRIKPGMRVGDVSNAIQRYVEKYGFSVIRKFVGHGIGKKLHLPPEVPNFGEQGKGDILRPRMALAIEPMVSAGDYDVMVLDDGWTVKTVDGSLSAHFEHTVVIKEKKALVIT